MTETTGASNSSDARACPTPREEEIVLISAIEHYLYCPRQCALIHLEQTFDENIFTLRGRHHHQRVDQAGSESEGDIRIERGLPLWSQRLGLAGKADIVEFHEDVPYPIDYKLGRRKQWDSSDAQLCAQALCLEEMLQYAVPRGAIYHVSSKRRREVQFNSQLRDLTEQTIKRVREMIRRGHVPPPVKHPRCTDCSLIDSCLPDTAARSHEIRQSISSLFIPKTQDE